MNRQLLKWFALGNVDICEKCVSQTDKNGIQSSSNVYSKQNVSSIKQREWGYDILWKKGSHGTQGNKKPTKTTKTTTKTLLISTICNQLMAAIQYQHVQNFYIKAYFGSKYEQKTTTT